VRYLYGCDKCKTQVEITKPSTECSREEKCKVCDTVMDRIYTAPAISTADGRKS